MQTCSRFLYALPVVPLLLLISGRATAADPAPDPTINEALHAFSADDFATRRNALLSLERALNLQAFQMLALDDPEVSAQVGSALQYSRRLSTWLITVNALPADQRKAQLAVLRRTDLAPLFVKIFSDNPQDRIAAIRDVEHAHDATLDPLLFQLLNDEDLQVALALMNSLWDRPAAPNLINALWRVGIGSDPADVLSPPVSITTTKWTFHGADLNGYTSQPNVVNLADARSTAARLTLAHLAGPTLDHLLTSWLTAASDSLRNDPNLPLSYAGNIHYSLYALTSLAEQAKSTAALPALLSLATVPLTPKREHQYPGLRYFSIHTDALAAILTITNQDPVQFGLSKGSTLVPWISASKQAETATIEKVQQSLGSHATDATNMAGQKSQ